jgi:hypothetical protein
MLRKMALLITSLELLACATVPKVPRHVQYGIYPNVEPPGFYGVDNETKERHYQGFMSQEMAGGQCLTAADYKSWAAWVQQVEEIAQRRCK